VITEFKQKHPEISLNEACKTLMLSRSTYYFIVNPSHSFSLPRGRSNTHETFNIFQERAVSDSVVIKEIEEILSRKFVLYGYKKVTAALRRKGYLINHKKTYRLMKEKGLLLKEFFKKNYHKEGRRDIIEEVEAPNQKWSIDIKHGKADNGEKGYVIAVKDCFTKEIIASTVRRKHTAREVEEVLYFALANRNLKELPIRELYVTSDNGKEITKAMESLKEIGIVHCRITPHSPWENGEIESFFSCIEREVFQRFEIEDFEGMRKLVSEYIEFYNNERVHGGIGYKTPRERYLEFVSSQEGLANVSG
jgi:putative transposase